MSERLRRRRTVYHGRVLDLHVDEVALPDGRDALREVVEHRGAVVLVPLIGDDVLLVRQYRHAVGRDLLELPAGTIGAGEEALAAAARELAEETGYRPGRLEELAALWPSPGFSTERMFIYRATELEPHALAPDDDEQLELVRMPLAAALAMASRGELDDMKTVVGLLLIRGE